MEIETIKTDTNAYFPILKKGVVFKITGVEGRYFMKTVSVNGYNAVDLSTGDMYKMSTEDVFVVRTKLQVCEDVNVKFEEFSDYVKEED